MKMIDRFVNEKIVHTDLMVGMPVFSPQFGYGKIYKKMVRNPYGDDVIFSALFDLSNDNLNTLNETLTERRGRYFQRYDYERTGDSSYPIYVLNKEGFDQIEDKANTVAENKKSDSTFQRNSKVTLIMSGEPYAIGKVVYVGATTNKVTVSNLANTCKLYFDSNGRALDNSLSNVSIRLCSEADKEAIRLKQAMDKLVSTIKGTAGVTAEDIDSVQGLI